MIEDIPDGERLDRGINFFEASDASEVIEVSGAGGGAGRGGFPGHDERGAEAYLGSIQFVFRNSLMENLKLMEHHVEGLLGLFGAGSDVGPDGGVRSGNLMICADGVAESPFFADFGEKPAAHASG